MLAELERLSAISWQPLLDISKEYKEAYPGDGGWVRVRFGIYLCFVYVARNQLTQTR